MYIPLRQRAHCPHSRLDGREAWGGNLIGREEMRRTRLSSQPVLWYSCSVSRGHTRNGEKVTFSVGSSLDRLLRTYIQDGQSSNHWSLVAWGPGDAID
jgi:hypothetical protein